VYGHGVGLFTLDFTDPQWAETPKTWPKSKKMMYVFQDFYLGIVIWITSPENDILRVRVILRSRGEATRALAKHFLDV
jgi:hypothetical protein